MLRGCRDRGLTSDASSRNGTTATPSPSSSGVPFVENRQLVLDTTFTIRGLPFSAFKNNSATAALPCLATLVASAAADFSGAGANASVWLYSVFNGDGYALFGAQTLLREAYSLSAAMCEKAGLSVSSVAAAAASDGGNSSATIITGSGVGSSLLSTPALRRTPLRRSSPRLPSCI